MGNTEIINYLIKNIFLMLLLIFAYSYIHKQLIKGDREHRALRFIFILLLCLITLDFLIVYMISLSLNSSASLIFKTILALQAMFVPGVGIGWYFYVWRVVKPKIARKTNLIIVRTLLGINALLTILSMIPNWNIYFSFNSDGLPSIGKAHVVYIILIIIPYLVSLVVNFAKWKKARQKYNPIVLTMISIIPLISYLVQYLINDYSIFFVGMVLSFIVAILDLQYHYAITDFLTGLYNRRNLIKYLASKMANLQPNEVYAGFMLDINNFKSINDHYGHAFGDKVLIDISSLLLQMVSRGNYVARFGGDEFVVIARIYDDIDIEAIRQKIVKACDSYNEVNKETHTITFSIGVATFKLGDNYNSSRFLELIDQKMYAHKNEIKQNNNDC